MNDMSMQHWMREIADFEEHLTDGGDDGYRSWQPTKWQSLETIRDTLLRECWAGKPPAGASALELGCGSATLLIQLQSSGIQGVGVDRDEIALHLARKSAESLGAAVPTLQKGDFFSSEFTRTLEAADLVFHIGVIEHMEATRQLEFLRLSGSLSRRWILVAIPNEGSPVFRSFLASVRSDDTVYDDPHHEIDMLKLIRDAGYTVHAVDGAHLFFSSPKFYQPGDAALESFYESLRDKLVDAGGERYSPFPYVSFESKDIPTLRSVEESIPIVDRMRFGFLRYYLIDTAAAANATTLVERAVANPRTTYNDLRENGSVVWDEDSQAWYVLGADDVRKLSRDERLRARGIPEGVYQLSAADRAIVEPVERFFARWLVFSDPPKQTLIRRVLAPHLTGSSMSDHIEALPEQALQILGGLSGDNLDLLRDVVLPLSKLTANAVLGTTRGEGDAIERLSAALIDYLATPGIDVAKARVAQVAIDDLVVMVRSLLNRNAGVARSLADAKNSGMIDELDVAAAYAQLLTGAVEPLTTALAACLLESGNLVDLAAKSVAEFIESTLRSNPPFHFSPRVATTDITVGGAEISSGQRVVLNLLAANQDDCPHGHDNENSKNSLSFGSGTHYCLGAAISRAHLEAVLPPLIRAGLPGRIDRGGVIMHRSFGATSYKLIPLKDV